MSAPPRIMATRLETAGRGEDRFVIEHRERHDIIAVADGAGGTGAGAAAADFVCARIIACAPARASTRTAWADILREADTALLASGCGGETTAVAIETSSTSISGASVGDSGAWLVTASAVFDLTTGQRRKPLLGSGSSVPVGFERPLTTGRLLVATDGLLAYAPPHEIAALVRAGDLELAASSLVARVRLRSGALADDVALVLCEIEGG